MGRQKKNKPLQIQETNEGTMTEEKTLDNIESQIDKARAELEATKIEIEEKKQQLKTMPCREIDAEEMIIVKKHHQRNEDTKGLRDKIEKQKIYDNEKVTGKFMNRRVPGQPAKLTYLKYEDDPVKWYTFDDGKVYTIPRGFADQINEHYYSPHFIQKGPGYIMDPSRPESAIHDVDTSNKKYAFVPVGF